MTREEILTALENAKLHAAFESDVEILDACMSELREQVNSVESDTVKGCECCSKGFAVLGNTMDYSGLEFAMMNRVIRVRYFPTHKYDTFQTQAMLPVKFCPMCGRRLEEEKEV